MGIQVRKIDCVLPPNNTAYLRIHNAGNGKNGQSLSDTAASAPIDESTHSAEQMSMDCDPKLKPIATQSCTTGIECTTIINDNIGSGRHEDDDRITNASHENEQENDGDEEEEDKDIGAADNDNEQSQTDNVDQLEEVNVDQAAYETSAERNNDPTEEDVESNTGNASAESQTLDESSEADEVEVFYDLRRAWRVFYDIQHQHFCSY